MVLNRRKISRWQVERPTKIKLAGAEEYAHGDIKDINFKGAQISLAMKLPKDTFLKLILVLADDFYLNVEAWVVWHKTVDGHNLYGLYFSKINDADKEKIYRFMLRDFPQQLDERWWQRKKEGGEIMADARFEDKRVFQRFPAKFLARFLDKDSNRDGWAQTYDISAKGVGLVTKEELPTHAPLELWLEIPDKGTPLYTRGEVVWSKPLGLNEYRVGIDLEKADLMGVSRVLRVR